MNASNPFDVYRGARRTAFVRLQELRERMDAWLEEHEEGPVSVSALALLEGLNSERDLAIHALQNAETKLMEHLLSRLKTDAPQEGQTAQN
jgi:hypothetical protein